MSRNLFYQTKRRYYHHSELGEGMLCNSRRLFSINNFKMIYSLSLYIIFFLISSSQSQIRIAVSEFSNQSDEMLLDGWQRSVPDLLKTQLSDDKDIIVLDRSRLDKVLEEKALSLSGLMDSSQAQSLGKLLDAEFILSGSIDKQGNQYIISADLIRVKNGQIQTEIVRSSSRDYLDEMVEMLAQNFTYRLTGRGIYEDRREFTSNSVLYWAGATALFGGVAWIANSSYKDNLDKYNKTSQLKNFDKFYDRANNSKNIYTGFVISGAAAFIVTLIDLAGGSIENEIVSGRQGQTDIKPFIKFDGENEFSLAIQINF